MSSLRERCLEIVAEVMEVDAESINDDANPDTIDNWDSLSHVQLVIKLEKEFGIAISPEEGVEHFTDFKRIVDYVSQKSAA